jgi:acetyl-CoA acetyltransferase
MKSAVIVSYKRTAFGAFGGSAAHLSATDLAEKASLAYLEDAKVDPRLIDAVIFGMFAKVQEMQFILLDT